MQMYHNNRGTGIVVNDNITAYSHIAFITVIANQRSFRFCVSTYLPVPGLLPHSAAAV